jgi:hypothetical protein
MGDSGENREISGLEAFLSKPESTEVLEWLFYNVEKYLYHKVDFGVSLVDRDVYELARYIGKLQILVNYGVYLMEHSKDENVIKEIGKKIYDIVNGMAIIYTILADNTEMNRYNNVFRVFTDKVNDLNDLIFKFVHI